MKTILMSLVLSFISCSSLFASQAESSILKSKIVESIKTQNKNEFLSLVATVDSLGAAYEKIISLSRKQSDGGSDSVPLEKHVMMLEIKSDFIKKPKAKEKLSELKQGISKSFETILARAQKVGLDLRKAKYRVKVSRISDNTKPGNPTVAVAPSVKEAYRYVYEFKLIASYKNAHYAIEFRDVVLGKNGPILTKAPRWLGKQ